MNEVELKVQALLESLGEQTQKYEDKIADLRVEITILSQRNQELAGKLEEQSKTPEALEGKVV